MQQIIKIVIGLCLLISMAGQTAMAENSAKQIAGFRQQAEQGHAWAQYRLGWAYWNGEGVGLEKDDAVEWFRKAAEQGHAGAQNNLGVAYWTGEGIVVDKDKEVEWYRRAPAVDKVEAMKWWRKSAEQGNASAQGHLGSMYENGDVVARDDVEAVKWYRKAVVQGDAVAQYNLGNAYWYGRGVNANKAEAMRWYRKAAAQGHAKAKRVLQPRAVTSTPSTNVYLGVRGGACERYAEELRELVKSGAPYSIIKGLFSSILDKADRLGCNE